MKSQKEIFAWEQSVVEQAKAGNPTARQLLVSQHAEPVRRHARRMLHSREDAEDAVQDTFVKAFRALGGFDSSRPFAPWVMRICTNCCVDIIRQRQHRCDDIEAHAYSLADEGVSVDSRAESRIMLDHVKGSIERLPARYREIIEMRHFQHMNVDEIARELGKPEGTVKSWLFRARALLRKDLQPALAS